MEKNWKDGDLLLIVLEQGIEIVGKWGSQDGVEEGFLKLYDAALVVIQQRPAPQGGVIQVQTFIPASEGGAFAKDIEMGKCKILFVKKVAEKQGFYNSYIEATTNIKPPSPIEEALLNKGPMGPVRRIR